MESHRQYLVRTESFRHAAQQAGAEREVYNLMLTTTLTGSKDAKRDQENGVQRDQGDGSLS